MYRIRRYSLPVSELHTKVQFTTRERTAFPASMPKRIKDLFWGKSTGRTPVQGKVWRVCMKTVRPAQFSTRVSAALKLIYLQVSRTSVYGTKIKTGIVCVCKLGNEWLLLPSVADYPALSNVRRKTVCSQCGKEREGFREREETLP